MEFLIGKVMQFDLLLLLIAIGFRYCLLLMPYIQAISSALRTYSGMIGYTTSSQARSHEFTAAALRVASGGEVMVYKS